MRPTPRALALPLLLALAACTPTPVVTPSPTPTYQCTPEAGGAAARCTEREYQDMVAKDALYAEAEQVFRAYTAEDSRITFHSTEATASDVLKGLMTAEAAAGRSSAYATVRQQGLSGGDGDTRVVSVKRAVGLVRGASVVALDTCNDASHIAVLQNGKATGATGRLVKATVFFTREGTRLLVSEIDGSPVASC